MPLLKPFSVFFIVSSLMIYPCFAEEPKKEATNETNSELTPMGRVLFFEASSLAVAATAGLLPRTIGSLQLLGITIGAVEWDWSSHPYQGALVTVAGGSLGIYNVLGPNPEGDFKWETAAVNFAAMNLLLGGVLLMEHYFPIEKSETAPAEKQDVTFELETAPRTTVVVARFRF